MKAKDGNTESSSKKAFLATLAPNLTAAEVVARAKEGGVEVSPSYAYAFVAQRRKGEKPKGAPIRGRRKNRTNGRILTRGGDSAGGSSSPPSPKKASPEARGRSPLDQQFLSLALELGLRRSEELLAHLKSNVRSLTGIA